MRTADFTYELPGAAIAQEPIEPRDAARLLVVAGMEDRRFADLPSLLDPSDVVVVNRTRVRRARLVGVKEPGGGRVEALLLRAVGGDHWEALVRPARRLRPGVSLRFGAIAGTVVDGPRDGRVTLRLDTGGRSLDEALADEGAVPLPPYFTGELVDEERYQTVFADRVGSAAAPTAGLHFTPAVLAGLAARDIPVVTVDLEIGLDTFRPITTEVIEDHRIHTEQYRVDGRAAEVIEARRRSGGRVVAVGTTVVRALESAAGDGGRLCVSAGATDLYITPGYRFTCVDVLVTNFHVPGSTLLVLVEAFMGPGWRDVYATALDRGYRFLSFGDAMLVERAS
jgi:S-adenosylmethionine:tRNA ribosyltransferase-isomerase